MRRSRANSSLVPKSLTAWSTPTPAEPIASAMPTSSSVLAVRLGVNRPSAARWFIVRDVLNPKAPASMPSTASRPISAISSPVGCSVWSAPRSPMT